MHETAYVNRCNQKTMFYPVSHNQRHSHKHIQSCHTLTHVPPHAHTQQMTVCWLLSSTNPHLPLTPSESCHLEKPRSTPKNVRAGNFLCLPWRGASGPILLPDVCLCGCGCVWLRAGMFVCMFAGTLVSVRVCVSYLAFLFVCFPVSVCERTRQRQINKVILLHCVSL